MHCHEPAELRQSRAPVDGSVAQENDRLPHEQLVAPAAFVEHVNASFLPWQNRFPFASGPHSVQDPLYVDVGVGVGVGFATGGVLVDCEGAGTTFTLACSRAPATTACGPALAVGCA
jgi:hypothetical protein